MKVVICRRIVLRLWFLEQCIARTIKEKHGLNSHFEIKWTKVSESKIDFYLELLDYFWKKDDLHYRGLVATGKDKLDHMKYNNDDYNLWYYKMYFRTLDPIIRQENEYHILVDIKDTKGESVFKN